MLACAAPVFADAVRIATFAAPFSRDGPGLLVRDMSRVDPQIDAAIAVVAAVSPDILLLTDVDYDHDHIALGILLARFAKAGVEFSYTFSAPPNAGMMTAFDLDQDGRFGGREDAQGYGQFAGNGGMAILSRWPIGKVNDFTDMLWRDLPGATLPDRWPEEVSAVQRLSSANHWIVPILHPDGAVNLMTYSATPPVFDGPEDRNGLRNRDELRLWTWVLDKDGPSDFVILGNTNLDPVDGDGLREAMGAFLEDPRLQDPRPASLGGQLAADVAHTGDPALDTADWPDDGPGNLRVSYVLPAISWQVDGAGVFWPAPDDPLAALLGDDGLAAGPHRLVWVDLSR